MVAELVSPTTTLVDGMLIGDVAATKGRKLPDQLVLVQAGGRAQVAVDWLDDGNGVRPFEVDVAVLEAAGPPGRWELRRSPGTRAAWGLTWPPSGSPELAEVSGGRIAWQRSLRGTTQVVVGGRSVVALDVEADGDELTVVVSGPDLTADELLTVELSSSTLAVPLRAVDPGAAGARQWRFPSFVSRFGLAARPLPSSTYQVTYRDRHGTKQVLAADASLRATVVREWLGPHHRIRLAATGNAVRIGLSAPLADEEVGRFAETALFTRYRQDESGPPDPTGPEHAVLFQSWDGGVAAGDQLALHHAVGDLRPGFTRYWAVADESVILPEGAVPVVLGSKAYLSALGRVRFLCSNTDLGPRVIKRSYQRFLQTFDGHPFSSTGRLYWKGRRGHPEAWVRAECARLNAAVGRRSRAQPARRRALSLRSRLRRRDPDRRQPSL